MNKLLILNILSTSLLFSCTSEVPEIRTACEKNQKGYTLKWEIYPEIKGRVKIFESLKSDSFVNVNEVAEKDIREGVAMINALNDGKRRYFKLVFDKKSFVFLSERRINTDRIDNLRDLGGYYNNQRKQIKWGKLYRSGSLSWINQKDSKVLDQLGIKTIIDLRSDDKVKYSQTKYRTPQLFNLPVNADVADSIRRKIIAGQMMRGDVLVALQDMYAHILEKDISEFEEFFNILLEEKNYPILFYCSFGKDVEGLVSMLILEALNVEKDQIMHDYLISNNYIDFNRAVVYARDLPTETQEALTTLLTADEDLLNFAYIKIASDYGSLDNYLEKKLNLTMKKREKLKEILLY